MKKGHTAFSSMARYLSRPLITYKGVKLFVLWSSPVSPTLLFPGRSLFFCRVRHHWFVPENHHVIKHIHQHRLRYIDITGQYSFTQRVHDFLLDKTFQRPGAVLRVVAVFAQVIQYIIAELQLDA